MEPEDMPNHGDSHDQNTSTAVFGGSAESSKFDQTQSEAEIANAVKTILKSLGEDPNREGLLKTPERFSKALQFFTSGYHLNPHTAINDAIFTVDYNNLIIEHDIDISSLCEHHLLPFFGKVQIAYLPCGQVLGLSKLPRIVEIYARRLQIQERLTQEIANAVHQVLKPQGVVVVMECSHMCMSMRGVRQVGATTVTECGTGVFLADPERFERVRGRLMKGSR